MKEVLIIKFYEHILYNHPDLLVALQNEGNVTEYLNTKLDAVDSLLQQLLSEQHPAYIIEELCLKELKAELGPSKYNYICAVLEEEFEEVYARHAESGVLTYEVMNMLENCVPVFERFGFIDEEEEDRRLRYAITGTIQEYLGNNQ